jgi:protein-L-isoaspartate(D-aspartate) O-methyltransferase
VTASPNRSYAAQQAELLAQIAAQARTFGPHLGRDYWRPHVLTAMAAVPRHRHVPAAWLRLAYADAPLPVDGGTTTSQPLVVALMTDLLDVADTHHVLEIGTGLGYATAVLGRLCAKVATIEIDPALAGQARERLLASGIDNVTYGVGDGHLGWPEIGAVDRIVVAGATDIIPEIWLRQLRPGGRLVVPAGLPGAQRLMVFNKDADGHLRSKDLMPVRFASLSKAADAHVGPLNREHQT